MMIKIFVPYSSQLACLIVVTSWMSKKNNQWTATINLMIMCRWFAERCHVLLMSFSSSSLLLIVRRK
jgi:hypothetical protein